LSYLHARVVLDFGDGGTDDVRQGDRHPPGPAGRGPGEDDQALRVASHTGGEVVETEEVAQLVRVVGAALHGVQQAQLAVDEHLAAAGEVDEDTGDAAGEFGALDRGEQGGAVHGGQGFRDLSRLVLRRDGPWAGPRLDVDLLTRTQFPHGVREFAPGDLQMRCCAGPPAR
jgi:hypothetical protein